ncbi:MAG: hypothetical protein HFJ05_06150 [Eubacterium sp.]|nr:hypothetical protein [Eubacterium sp.]
MNDRMRTRGRSAIYSMAGIYFLYTAYQLFKDRDMNTGSEYVLLLVIAAAFLLLGIGFIVFGLRTMSKIRKEDRQALEKKDL